MRYSTALIVASVIAPALGLPVAGLKARQAASAFTLPGAPLAVATVSFNPAPSPVSAAAGAATPAATAFSTPGQPLSTTGDAQLDALIGQLLSNPAVEQALQGLLGSAIDGLGGAAAPAPAPATPDAATAPAATTTTSDAPPEASPSADATDAASSTDSASADAASASPTDSASADTSSATPTDSASADSSDATPTDSGSADPSATPDASADPASSRRRALGRRQAAGSPPSFSTGDPELDATVAQLLTNPKVLQFMQGLRSKAVPVAPAPTAARRNVYIRGRRATFDDLE